ncbi:hypothetical protein [Mycobacterium sp. 1274761.0]|uniref:hypothetical protein n=1 Tax=Mycobacterium sp. 1274761.0 TaxID=1834077 RepID=UPI0007FD8D57|nr:hypothetical protein [Mycobacterium sp. 1274761.0]OBK76775.1 hypothetical protein A5651_05990 [Mycobacterium sp. 1274761.0]
MTSSGERQQVSLLAEEAGWQHRDADRSDYYLRRPERVHIVWQGDQAISGGALYRDNILMSTSRELDTVKGWLKR